MTYRTTPYRGGNYEAVQSLLEASSAGNVMMYTIGNSREDIVVSHGGRASSWQINRRLWQLYGPASQLPVVNTQQAWGSQSTRQQYLVNTAMPYPKAASLVTDDSYLPPRLPRITSGGTNFGTPIMLLTHEGISRTDVPTLVAETAGTKFDNTRADLVCDVFLKKSTAYPSCTDITWLHTPTDSTEQDAFQTATAFGNSNIEAGQSLNLDADDTSVVMYTTPPLAYAPANPYHQVAVRGSDGTYTAVEGLQVWGMRYRHSTLDRGVTHQSLAVGGTQLEDWIAAIQGNFVSQIEPFDNSKPAFDLMGLPDVVRLTLGINDYSGKVAGDYEDECREFIGLLRTFFAKPDLQIILESPYMRGGLAQVSQDLVEGIADAQYTIAEDTDNVAFYNMARAMGDLGYAPDRLDWTTDTIHANDVGDYRKSQLAVNFWAGVFTGGAQAASVVGGFATVDYLDPIERTPEDTEPIKFSWPVADAANTITATTSDGDAIVGALLYVGERGGYYVYTLDDTAVRPEAGAATYVLTDGTYTWSLRVVVREESEGGSLAGPGAIDHTIDVDDGNADPVAGVGVWVTTDAAGTNTIAGTLYTDTFGKVTFKLDPGDYFSWAQLSDWNAPTTGTPFTVEAP